MNTKPPTVTAQSYVAYRQDWLDRHREDALDPDLPIIDTHHHLYDKPRPLYLFEQLLADTRSGHNIVATVFMDSKSMFRADGPEHLRPVGAVGETALLEELPHPLGRCRQPAKCCALLAKVDDEGPTRLLKAQRLAELCRAPFERRPAAAFVSANCIE